MIGQDRRPLVARPADETPSRCRSRPQPLGAQRHRPRRMPENTHRPWHAERDSSSEKRSVLVITKLRGSSSRRSRLLGIAGQDQIRRQARCPRTVRILACAFRRRARPQDGSHRSAQDLPTSCSAAWSRGAAAARVGSCSGSGAALEAAAQRAARLWRRRPGRTSRPSRRGSP
jgi:hypothetical protein